MNNIKLDNIYVPYDKVCNLLRSAVESGRTFGCGYWCYVDRERSVRPPGGVDLNILGEYEDEETWYCQWALFEGGSICVEEHDEGYGSRDPVFHSLTLEKIKSGLSLMANQYPKKFAEVMCDEIDGPLGEEFLQLCVLGELKYG